MLKKRERVIAYIDGFNLYFGMKDANLLSSKWLNIRSLIENLISSNQELIEIKYFTSRVNNDPHKLQKQNKYLEALESVDIKLYYGRYQRNSIECSRCGNEWPSYKEKMTDVNIATHMIIDAFQDKYDMAMLISGDSDLVPPIKEIHNNFNNKRVFVGFPPKRHNQSVSIVAKGSLTIGKKKIKDSQFPIEVIKRDGYVLTRPDDWS